jgi:hypothetical protein
VTEYLNGVALNYTGGQTCPNGVAKTFTINVYCAADLELTNTYYDGIAYGDECNPYVNVVSLLGCDVLTTSLLWGDLALLEPYLGLIAVFAGFFFCFFGFKFLKPSVCIAGFMTTTLAFCLFYYLIYLNSTEEIYIFWYFLGVGILMGILLGFGLACFARIGATCLAGWGGFALGLLINESFLFQLELKWLFWTSTTVCIIICAVLGFVVYEHAVILSSAMLGGFFIMRGIAVYGGHYYNMFTVITMLKAGVISEIDA